MADGFLVLRGASAGPVFLARPDHHDDADTWTAQRDDARRFATWDDAADRETRARGYVRPDGAPVPVARPAWAPQERGEEFGPWMPHPDDDRDTRSRPGDAHRFFPGQGGGPVPVAIVAGAPQAARNGWLEGDRLGIEERAHRGAAMFRQDHEGTVGQRMMDHDAEVAPHVDTSGLDAAKTKGGEVHDVLAALAAIVISPSVNLGVFDAIIAKAREAKAAVDAIGSGRASGTSGAVGMSYPQTAPSGRQMGPR